MVFSLLREDYGQMICLDSGAHSQYKEYVKRNPAKGKDFFESDTFWKYIDEYAAFVKLHEDQLDFYVTLDVIFNPELTWKVQKYLEDTHKLHPLPVFHSYEDFKWLRKYLDNYDYIGIGGIGQTVGKNTWIVTMGDPIFGIICDTPDRMPRVKTHGFAIASPELFVKYPWFSVDSASWVIYGRYGGIIIPRKVKGKYDYSIPPWLIKTSWRNHHINIQGTHIDNITEIQKKEFVQYFQKYNVSLGKSTFKTVKKNYILQENESWADKKKNIVEIIEEAGVCNDFQKRDDMNLYYFLEMEKQIPKYPWSWYNKTRRIFI
jgi:hypothetical protein